MTKFFSVLIVLFLALVFFQPIPVLANSIGISPGEISVHILKGENSEQKFMVSRSETVKEYRFKISARTGAEYLNFNGQKELIMPIGQRIAEFPFSIRAVDLDLGDYKAEIEFALEPDSVVNNGSVILNFTLVGKVEFFVADEAFFLTQPIDVSSEPEAGNNIAVSDLLVTREEQSKKLVISWFLKNNGIRDLQKVDFDILIKRDDRSVYSKGDSVSEVIVAGHSVSGEQTFEPTNDLFPGVYKIIVSSGNSSQTVEIIIPDNFELLTVKNVVLMALFLILILSFWFNKSLSSLRKKTRLSTLKKTFKKNRFFRRRQSFLSKKL
jgi:hypothetical protein